MDFGFWVPQDGWLTSLAGARNEGELKHLVDSSSIYGVICCIAALEPPSGLGDRDRRILRPIALDEGVEGLDVLSIFCVREC